VLGITQSALSQAIRGLEERAADAHEPQCLAHAGSERLMQAIGHRSVMMAEFAALHMSVHPAFPRRR
jgi:hypothetical protein